MKNKRPPASGRRPDARSKAPTDARPRRPALGHTPGAHGQSSPSRQPRQRSSEPQSRDSALLYGFHSVREALRSSHRKVLKVYATPAAAERLAAEIAARGLVATLQTAEEIGRRLPSDAVHQGVLVEAAPLEPIAIADLAPDALVVVLDQVTDPHNIGAILRSCAAFGVDAIVTTERHTPAFAGVLAKAASGALEHVAVASVVNLARALEELGDRDFLRVGLDSEVPASLDEVELRRPLALVLGAEGKGLRRLTRENCDVLARLALPGKIKSLNVSNACAVALSITSTKLAGIETP